MVITKIMKNKRLIFLQLKGDSSDKCEFLIDIFCIQFKKSDFYLYRTTYNHKLPLFRISIDFRIFGQNC